MKKEKIADQKKSEKALKRTWKNNHTKKQKETNNSLSNTQ